LSLFYEKHESAGPTPYNLQKFVALREKMMKKCHFIVSSFARPKRKPKNYSKVHSSPIFHGECESAEPTPYNPQKFVALKGEKSDPHRFRSPSFWVRVLHCAAASQTGTIYVTRQFAACRVSTCGAVGKPAEMGSTPPAVLRCKNQQTKVSSNQLPLLCETCLKRCQIAYGLYEHPVP
jgi:hypothetical protein